jgi:murein endopeptidase
MWSKNCGKIPSDGGDWNIVRENGQRYFTNKPEMVR